MIGRHITAIIADAYAKGSGGFDLQSAYAGLKQSAMERTILPWTKGPAAKLDLHYAEKGLLPALPVPTARAVAPDPASWHAEVEKITGSRLPYQITWLPEVGVDEPVPQVDPWHRRQSVSVTLENAYDDWCLAQLARALGREEDYAYFMRRAGSYRNLFNPHTGFMAPNGHGESVEPFDPRSAAASFRLLRRMNAARLAASPDAVFRRWVGVGGLLPSSLPSLNRLFVEQIVVDKPAFLGQFPRHDGLIGRYTEATAEVPHPLSLQLHPHALAHPTPRPQHHEALV